MADTKMKVTGLALKALNPKAANKFETNGVAGRVINRDAETDGAGTAEVQLVHPDGTITKLADVTIPTLPKGEKMSLRVRICAGIRTAAAEVDEGALESK